MKSPIKIHTGAAPPASLRSTSIDVRAAAMALRPGEWFVWANAGKDWRQLLASWGIEHARWYRAEDGRVVVAHLEPAEPAANDSPQAALSEKPTGLDGLLRVLAGARRGLTEAQIADRMGDASAAGAAIDDGIDQGVIEEIDGARGIRYRTTQETTA